MNEADRSVASAVRIVGGVGTSRCDCGVGGVGWGGFGKVDLL